MTWPIASGGVHAGIIRPMRPTQGGDLPSHQSSTIFVELIGASKTQWPVQGSSCPGAEFERDRVRLDSGAL